VNENKEAVVVMVAAVQAATAVVVHSVKGIQSALPCRFQSKHTSA
jgi:hypothetical protein